MQKIKIPFSTHKELSRMMETGEPVCVTFESGEPIEKENKERVIEEKVIEEEEAEKVIKEEEEEEEAEKKEDKGKTAKIENEKIPVKSSLLFCELIQKARMGEVFLISGQSCSPGNYVLGLSKESPAAYYLSSGRYMNARAAEKAALSLPRLKKRFSFIRIEPLSLNPGNFDVLILFLKPEKAMRIVQANSYSEGKRTVLDTMGAASICGDCTVLALDKGIGLSFGCKGSRKHSGYEDFEVPLGISFEKVSEIEKGLSKLPETRK